eukprot:7837915-Karenia_brevis.AAC.1
MFRKHSACTFEALENVLFQDLRLRPASVKLFNLVLHILQSSFDGKEKHAVSVNIVEGIGSERTASSVESATPE